MSFSTNLKYLRKQKKFSQDYIAEKLGYKSFTTIQKWESGIAEPSVDKLRELADILNVSMDALLNKNLTEDNTSDITECFVKLPLYNPICCGNGGFVDDNVIEYISIPAQMLKPNKDYFANYALGDSMVGENIKDNDLIIFEKADTIENGQIGCFCVNDEDAMCKVYRCDAKTGLIMLLPANNEFAPITVSPDVDSFRVIGKLALVINDRQDK